jgi:hypothetical protein
MQFGSAYYDRPETRDGDGDQRFIRRARRARHTRAADRQDWTREVQANV